VLVLRQVGQLCWAASVLTVHAALPDERVIEPGLIGCEPPQRVHYVLCMVGLFLLPHKCGHLPLHYSDISVLAFTQVLNVLTSRWDYAPPDACVSQKIRKQTVCLKADAMALARGFQQDLWK
jgi:hypothetical protein